MKSGKPQNTQIIFVILSFCWVPHIFSPESHSVQATVWTWFRVRQPQSCDPMRYRARTKKPKRSVTAINDLICLWFANGSEVIKSWWNCDAKKLRPKMLERPCDMSFKALNNSFFLHTKGIQRLGAQELGDRNVSFSAGRLGAKPRPGLHFFDLPGNLAVVPWLNRAVASRPLKNLPVSENANAKAICQNHHGKKRSITFQNYNEDTYGRSAMYVSCQQNTAPLLDRQLGGSQHNEDDEDKSATVVETKVGKWKVFPCLSNIGHATRSVSDSWPKKLAHSM